MSEEEKLKLFISTPFRSFGTSRLFPNASFGKGDATKAAYVDALIAEIASASKDADGLLVDEVEFGYGPASSLASEQLDRVIRAVRKGFRLADDVRIHATEIPGGLTVDHAGFFKNNHVEYLEIELLSTDPLALAAVKLPPSAEGCTTCYQVAYFTGAPKLGILLNARFDSNERPFRRSVMEALGRDPLFVRATNLDEATESQSAILKALCEKHGLVEASAGALAEPGTLVFAQPDFQGFPAAHANQLGCGLNAVSVFDGIRFKTTDDLQRYIANSTDFPTIAKQI